MSFRSLFLYHVRQQIIQYAWENSVYIDFGTNLNPDGTINKSLIETKEKFEAKIYPLYNLQTTIK